MSINVTVHGNPISIKRGKMVALDGNKEFELRRRIRIQQVRQQSKRIAEDVRNKVRREKNRQLNKMGNEAQAEFKEKQAKKLTCLKQHYTGCMADFGRAFGDAENESDASEEINKLNEENRQQAELRGKSAGQKLQDEKVVQDYEKKKRLEDMKYARYVENVRSKLVSDLPKGKKSKKKWKKCLADIHINGEVQNVTEDSSYDSDIFNLSVLDETTENMTETCDDECKSDCNSKENFAPNQEKNENVIDDDANQKEETRSRGGTELPVCGEDSGKENTSYYSHEKHKGKNKPSSKTSQRLVAIADSLKQIAEEYKEGSTEPCIGAPCEKVLKDIMEAATSTISNKMRQSIQSSESSSKESLSCYCEPRNSACSICNINNPTYMSEEIQVSRNRPGRQKWYAKYTPQQSELDLSENDFLDGPVRPVITSEPVSPTKRKTVRIHQNSTSPEKFSNPYSFRKMLISSKNIPQKLDPGFQNECLELVSPIKIPHTRNKSPKKINRKKSSLHDSNYCLPTFPKKVPHKRCLSDFDYQLPTVPTTIIRPETETGTKQSNVKFYDHFNRFSKEEFQPALVQKISKESIDIIPDDVSDIQSQNILCRKRDQEAKMRGYKALEKVKIHQDYQKLLQELPVLQRQERLANMPMHNPSLHMSNDRYQIYERKKQNAMENKFESMQSKALQFDKPPITLKSVRKSPPCSGSKVPLQTLDVTDENTVLNVGTWIKANSTTSSEQRTNEGSPSNANSEIAIADLLKRVNKQRELLLKEAVNMKSLAGLKDILNEEELINIICNCRPPQKVLVETGTSPLNKHIQSPQSSKQRSSSSCLKSPKRSAVSSSDTSVETSRTKTSKIKPKVKKLKIFLREESTQTSPFSSTKTAKKTVISSSKKEGFTQTSLTSHSLSSQKSKMRRPKSQRSVSSAKSLAVSKSARQESSSDKSDKVCEIIIRTGDQNVKINPISTGVQKDLSKKDVVIKIKEGKGDVPQKNALDMSTSTSYMSPPIEIKSKEKPCPADLSVNETSRPSNRHLLQPQKQQTNLDKLVRIENGMKEINPRLIKYIMRLLNMSRQSIDELTISSVSDVSTPQDSIILTANNVAREKLQTVMDHFNLSADDIKKICLSSSTLSDITADIRQAEEKAHKESSNKSGNVKQYTCVAPTNEKDGNTQVCFQEKQSSSALSEEEKYLKEKREKDIYASTSSGYRGSKSRSPPLSSTTPRKDFSSVCPDKHDSKSTAQETRETSRPSSSPTTNFRLSSPKSTTIRSTTVSPKSTSVKVALPKLDSTSDPYSTIPSSIQQTNIPKTPIKSPLKQEIIAKYGNADTSSEEIMLNNPEKFLQFVRESLGMSVEEFSELGFEEMFSRHMELTEYCHDRIRSLMSLIEQIRNEKREICSSSSPVDNSMTLTSYLDLPPSKSKQTNVKDTTTDQDQEYSACVQSCLENDISSGSSISQEAIDKYLLGIGNDVELNKKKNEGKQREKPPGNIRLQSGECKEQCGGQQSFVPMLQGIPKYSEANVVDAKMPSFLGDLLHQIRPKPPPALLRSNMRGHTNETPHELSTIAEADTMISSRNTSMHRPRSPEEKIPSKDVSPRPICRSPLLNSPIKRETNKSLDQTTSTNSSAAYVTISPERTLRSDETKNRLNKLGLMETLNNSESTPETGTKSGLSGIHSLSETSQETPDELESLLRKFKLEWAISLVKKTEQALALSSSSSSSDVRGIKDVSSDVSVRESVRHLCKKLASLNDSDIERAQIVSDLSQHFREFHDISEIPGVADSKNKSHQRTSTPVQHSKSTESKKSITNESLFKVDSELSSVKNTSDENYDQLFLSIPNVTLNTEHISLMKT